MPKRVQLDKIEYYPQTGAIALEWSKLSSDGDVLAGAHRALIQDHVDDQGKVIPVSVADRLAAVDIDLAGQGFAPTDPKDLAMAHAIREAAKPA